MDIFKTFAIIAASSWLVGCIGTGTGDNKDTGGADTDSGDTTTPDTDDTDEPMAGPPTWDITGWTGGWQDAVMLTCNEAEGTVLIQLRTTNWGYPPARLYLAGTRFPGTYDEEHTMEETDRSDSAAGYSIFERQLTANDVPNTPDSTTLFRCDAFEDGGDNFDVTIAAGVSDSTGTIVDCIVFGQNPDAIIGGAAGFTIPSWVDSSCQNGNM
jgi:hypothetical protein